MRQSAVIAAAQWLGYGCSEWSSLVQMMIGNFTHFSCAFLPTVTVLLEHFEPTILFFALQLYSCQCDFF